MTTGARDRMYLEFEHLWSFDQGGLLQLLLGAIGEAYEDLYQLTIEDRDGIPWGALLDPVRAPVAALPYLAQFVGTVLPSTATEAAARSQIANAPNLQRGTIAGMRAAAQATMVDAGFGKQVTFFERLGGAWKLTVNTNTAETPDSVATLAALVSMKPAGITLTYNVISGQTWAHLKATYATWTLAKAAYANWGALKTGP